MGEPEGNKTSEFLGGAAERLRARITVTNVSAFSGGWCLFLDGEGHGAVVLVSIPVVGQGPGLGERRFALALTVGEAQAMFLRCVEHDLASVTLAPPPPAPGVPCAGPAYARRPDEPWVEVTLRNAAGAQVSAGKPLGLELPRLDAVVRAAHDLTRTVRDQPPQVEGPWRTSWTPWK